MTTLRLATRTSPLAIHQAKSVATLLRALFEVETVELVPVESKGDQLADVPIASFAARGMFTRAVDQLVIDGRAELAVHSAKDLPATDSDDGLVIGAVPMRSDPRDALIGSSLDDLAPGAVVATGAVRRRVQLAFIRPDLGFAELRGNIGTRIEKASAYGAAVVAMAALDRLGLRESVAEVLPTTVMLPQVGQGALAVRCRSDDLTTLAVLSQIDNTSFHRALLTERAFLRCLGGDCDTPVAAYAESDNNQLVRAEALIASSDGHVIIRHTHQGSNPEDVGDELANALLSLGGNELINPRGFSL